MKQQEKGKDGAGGTVLNETNARARAIDVSCASVSHNTTDVNTPSLARRLLECAIELFDCHVASAEYHQSRACDARRIWQALERLVGDD